MKKLVFLWMLFFFLLSLSNKAQTSAKEIVQSIHVPTNVERFTKDYEIKGWNKTIQDTVKVNSLNLNYYDSQRHETNDLEFVDDATGLVVIVYSGKKTTANKK